MINAVDEILKEYKFYFVDVTMPRFNSEATIDYLQRLTWGASRQEEPPKKLGFKSRLVTFKFDAEDRFKEFKKALAEVFAPSFLTIAEREAPRFESPLSLFEHLTGTHDWHYYYSDDHRVWSSGEAQQKRIVFLGKALLSTHKEEIAVILKKHKLTLDFLK